MNEYPLASLESGQAGTCGEWPLRVSGTHVHQSACKVLQVKYFFSFGVTHVHQSAGKVFFFSFGGSVTSALA